jgi:hypothetical protein
VLQATNYDCMEFSSYSIDTHWYRTEFPGGSRWSDGKGVLKDMKRSGTSFLLFALSTLLVVIPRCHCRL